MSFKDKIFKNQSPWGSPPPGGGGRAPGGNGSGSRQDPPNLDDIIKNFQKTINKFSGGKSGGSRPIIIGLLILDCLIMKLSSPDFLRFSIAKENDPTPGSKMISDLLRSSLLDDISGLKPAILTDLLKECIFPTP